LEYCEVYHDTDPELYLFVVVVGGLFAVLIDLGMVGLLGFCAEA